MRMKHGVRCKSEYRDVIIPHARGTGEEKCIYIEEPFRARITWTVVESREHYLALVEDLETVDYFYANHVGVRSKKDYIAGS